MAITYTARLNLPVMDVGEVGWGEHLNDGMQDADDRFFLFGAGSPQGVATSQYLGQRYWDTTAEVWYTATVSGVDNAWAIESDLTSYLLLDGTRPMTGGLRHPNNVFLQFRDLGDANWRDLLGIDGSDVAKLGHASHELTLVGSAFADFLALMGGVSRRILVADASDDNVADNALLLNDFDNTLAANLVSGGTGEGSSWQSYLKLPILIGGNPVVVNFGHQVSVPVNGQVVPYAYTYLSTCHFVNACISNGASNLGTSFSGLRIGVGSTPLVSIRLDFTSSVGLSASMYWFAIGV